METGCGLTSFRERARDRGGEDSHGFRVSPPPCNLDESRFQSHPDSLRSETTGRHMQLPAVAEKAQIEDLRLGDVPMQQEVELVSIDLPVELAEPLLERGVLPGCRICPVQSSPGGDPVVSIDGSLLALRRETADCLCVRLVSSFQDVG